MFVGGEAESGSSPLHRRDCVCVCMYTCILAHKNPCRDLGIPDYEKCLVLWEGALDQESRVMLIEI